MRRGVSCGLTTKLSDRRRGRAQAMCDDVHKSNDIETETAEGRSLDSMLRLVTSIRYNEHVCQPDLVLG